MLSSLLTLRNKKSLQNLKNCINRPIISMSITLTHTIWLYLWVSLDLSFHGLTMHSKRWWKIVVSQISRQSIVLPDTPVISHWRQQVNQSVSMSIAAKLLRIIIFNVFWSKTGYQAWSIFQISLPTSHLMLNSKSWTWTTELEGSDCTISINVMLYKRMGSWRT